MKLYNAPRGVWLRLSSKQVEETHVPPAARPVGPLTRFRLHNLDGMYSRCSDEHGNTLHPAAWTEVEVCDVNPSHDKQGTFSQD